MMMPGRNTEYSWSRMGVQKQQKDDEIYGKGNTYAFKYRMEDSRIIRFFSTDPLHGKYPHNSDYAFSENRFIDGIDLEGLEFCRYDLDANDPNVKEMARLDGVSNFRDSKNYQIFNESRNDIVEPALEGVALELGGFAVFKAAKWLYKFTKFTKPVITV
ncbi:MAG: hypothetical protein WC716_14830 [Chitinophagaceae bacterium]